MLEESYTCLARESDERDPRDVNKARAGVYVNRPDTYELMQNVTQLQCVQSQHPKSIGKGPEKQTVDIRNTAVCNFIIDFIAPSSLSAINSPFAVGLPTPLGRDLIHLLRHPRYIKSKMALENTTLLDACF